MPPNSVRVSKSNDGSVKNFSNMLLPSGLIVVRAASSHQVRALRVSSGGLSSGLRFEARLLAVRESFGDPVRSRRPGVVEPELEAEAVDQQRQHLILLQRPQQRSQ